MVLLARLSIGSVPHAPGGSDGGGHKAPGTGAGNGLGRGCWALLVIREPSQDAGCNREAEDQQGEKGEHNAHSDDHQFKAIFQHGILATGSAAGERASLDEGKCLERRAFLRSGPLTGVRGPSNGVGQKKGTGGARAVRGGLFQRFSRGRTLKENKISPHSAALRQALGRLSAVACEGGLV